MAQFTEKAIMQAFYELLKTTSFDKVTVSAIIERCGISSNTFYYHFRDIYDLLDTCLEEKKKQYISRLPQFSTWQEMLKAMLREMRAHQAVVSHIYESLSRDRLECYLFESTNETIEQLVRAAAAGRALSEEKLQDISQFCRYAFLGFFMRFLWSRMSFDIDETVDRLAPLFESFLLHAVEDSCDGPGVF